jgi:hypothetical protein
VVVALYEYKAQRGDELDLAQGDEILVLVKENDSWWMGQLMRTGREGYFPASYVQEKLYDNQATKNAVLNLVNKKTGELF